MCGRDFQEPQLACAREGGEKAGRRFCCRRLCRFRLPALRDERDIGKEQDAGRNKAPVSEWGWAGEGDKGSLAYKQEEYSRAICPRVSSLTQTASRQSGQQILPRAVTRGENHVLECIPFSQSKPRAFIDHPVEDLRTGGVRRSSKVTGASGAMQLDLHGFLQFIQPRLDAWYPWSCQRNSDAARGGRPRPMRSWFLKV